MYALVLLRPHRNRQPSRELDAEHEAFITAQIRRNEILLGGEWARAAGSFEAAYLLRKGSLGEARALAEDDPYVREGAFEAEIVEWRLVGVNPDAIDPEVVLRPTDV